MKQSAVQNLPVIDPGTLHSQIEETKAIFTSTTKLTYEIGPSIHKLGADLYPLSQVKYLIQLQQL